MEEDLISSLTRQVKDEVIENYLTERRLIRYQIDEIESRTMEIKLLSATVGKRLNRLAHLMVQDDMKSRLLILLRIPQPSFWLDCVEMGFSRRIRFIRVNALTDRRKFRKLVFESYRRLHAQMANYQKKSESLCADCEAVNHNIRSFQSNFDLLAILSFLRSLDIRTLERKQLLGENFTAEELASVDQKLYIRPLCFADLDIPLPLQLLSPGSVESALSRLSDEVYGKYEQQVRNFML